MLLQWKLILIVKIKKKHMFLIMRHEISLHAAECCTRFHHSISFLDRQFDWGIVDVFVKQLILCVVVCHRKSEMMIRPMRISRKQNEQPAASIAISFVIHKETKFPPDRILIHMSKEYAWMWDEGKMRV